MLFKVLNSFLLSFLKLLLESLDLPSKLEYVFLLISPVFNHDDILINLMLLLLIKVIVVATLVCGLVEHGLMLYPLLQLSPLLLKHEVVILEHLDESLVVLDLFFVVQLDFLNLDLHSKVIWHVRHLLQHSILSHKVLNFI